VSAVSTRSTRWNRSSRSHGFPGKLSYPYAAREHLAFEARPGKADTGSSVLATTQQSSRALGVATLGSLYLTLATRGMLGPDAAASIVHGVVVLNAPAVAAVSRGCLPEEDLMKIGVIGTPGPDADTLPASSRRS
jgi:hypothetical protein